MLCIFKNYEFNDFNFWYKFEYRYFKFEGIISGDYLFIKCFPMV